MTPPAQRFQLWHGFALFAAMLVASLLGASSVGAKSCAVLEAPFQAVVAAVQHSASHSAFVAGPSWRERAEEGAVEVEAAEAEIDDEEAQSDVVGVLAIESSVMRTGVGDGHALPNTVEVEATQLLVSTGLPRGPPTSV